MPAAAESTATGGPKSDNIPIWAYPGEHVLAAADVARMGGQAGVYAFRNSLHMQGGGNLPTFRGQRLARVGFLE